MHESTIYANNNKQVANRPRYLRSLGVGLCCLLSFFRCRQRCRNFWNDVLLRSISHPRHRWDTLLRNIECAPRIESRRERSTVGMWSNKLSLLNCPLSAIKKLKAEFVVENLPNNYIIMYNNCVLWQINIIL